MASQPPVSRPMLRMVRTIQEDLQELKSNWYWFLILGLLLIVLGMVALSYSVATSVVSVLVFSYFLLLGGALYIFGAFFTNSWGGFFLSLFAGVLHLALGTILMNHPTEAAIVYTLLLAVFFFVDGLFRIGAALMGQFRHWGIVLLNGIITLMLGVLIWKQWPVSGLYVIGLFVGINLLFSGIQLVILGLGVRNLPVGGST